MMKFNNEKMKDLAFYKIEIDTIGSSNLDKWVYNEELFNIIVPNIKFIQEGNRMYKGEDVKWERYREELKGNGHCVYIKGNAGYLAAYEFDYLWFEYEFLKKYGFTRFLSDVETLTELLESVAKTENIDYKVVN